MFSGITDLSFVSCDDIRAIEKGSVLLTNCKILWYAMWNSEIQTMRQYGIILQ